MGMDKLQVQQMEQKQMEESRQASRADLDKQFDAINRSAREHQNNMQRIDKAVEAKETTQIAKLLNTPADKANVALLAKLTASVASSNIDLNPQNMAAKVASEMGHELNLLLQVKPEAADLVMMSKPVTKTEQDGIQKQQQNKNKKSGKDLSGSRETVSTVKEYVASYASSIVNAAGEVKRKMERLEDELRDKGLSDKEIKSIKGGVRKSVASDLSKMVKDAFLRKMLGGGKGIERVMASKNLNDALKLASSAEDSGPSHVGGFKGLASALFKEARSEAKDFVLEELEGKVMEKILRGQTRELDSQIKALIGLAVKLGVNMPAFMTRWKKKKMDLGLFWLDPNLSAEVGTGDPNEQRESRYDIEKPEEKEILMNRLRALYMRRAMKGDIITRLDTAFKMRKLKNGLIKLGLQIDDFQRIEKEGVAVARGKLLDMLKEALAERSTLYKLAGPAFKLLEKRIKGIMSNLDRIGEALTVAEFENLRDTANRKMYDMAVQELHAVDALLKEKANPKLDKKRGHLIKLITRLKEESGIEGVDLDPRSMELLAHGLKGLKVIQENA